MFNQILLSAIAGAVGVSAHGYVTNVVINGIYYAGYDVTTAPYESDPPTVIGWATSATDLGYVAPDAYNSSDIICHKDGTNAEGHATIAAGDQMFLQWTDWPESHKGPVLTYLAACGDTGCESVDKTTLEFFKIDEKGLIDGSTAAGTYAADELEENGEGWMVQIPSNIASGYYVMRHEIIALHGAESEDGAQNYPQCFNLEITGGGSDVPSGTLGTALYNEDDAGILVNIYVTTDTYVIPGPTMISGATDVSQSTSAITATGTATTGTALASGSAATTTAAATTAAATTAATSAGAAAGGTTATSSATSSKATTSAQTTVATTFSTAVASKSSSKAASTQVTSAATSASACKVSYVTTTVLV